MKNYKDMTPADLAIHENAVAALTTISDLDALIEDLIANCPEARSIIGRHALKNANKP